MVGHPLEESISAVAATLNSLFYFRSTISHCLTSNYSSWGLTLKMSKMHGNPVNIQINQE